MGAAIFNVPVATRAFVGRHEQLQQLAERLSGDGTVAITQVQAIHGLGGVGRPSWRPATRASTARTTT